MASDEILIKKNEMLDVAKNFEIEGKNLEDLICNLNNYYRILSNEGEGEAVEAILEKIIKTINIGDNIRRSIYNAQKVISEVVNIFEEADESLKEEFLELIPSDEPINSLRYNPLDINYYQSLIGKFIEPKAAYYKNLFGKISESVTTNYKNYLQTIANVKKEDSILNGEIKKQAEVNGKKYSIDATGKIIGYEASGEFKGKFDIDKGNVEVGVEGKVEGYLAKGEVKVKEGMLTETISGTVGNVGASGEAKVALFEGGEFDPKVILAAEAKAQGIKGSVEESIGTDDFNVHAGAEGVVGEASAKAEFKIDKDSGIDVEAGAEASVFKGEVKTGFTLFGIKTDVVAEGKALSIGAGAGAEVDDDSIQIGANASFLAGLGLKIKISW